LSSHFISSSASSSERDFGEEFLFRGFLFQWLAMLLGGTKVAWAVACLIQAILFGLIHAYQNPLGMLLTGSIGLVMGVVFLSTARNLWVPIIAHTLYDTARVIAFYVHGRHRGERPAPLVAVQPNYYAFGLNSARESQGTTARR
jgi:membrane protease YdiL (CAAX protease family)